MTDSKIVRPARLTDYLAEQREWSLRVRRIGKQTCTHPLHPSETGQQLRPTFHGGEDNPPLQQEPS